MAGMSVPALRERARAAMLSCGARGFMRFAQEGEGLLVTDAASRCGDGGAALAAALEQAGFVCRGDGRLTRITPGDALLERLCAAGGEPAIDWESPLHPAQALAARLMREAHAPLSDAGRALVLSTARLMWQPESRVLAGLADIRALTAVRLREGNRNGFYQTGALLANWCETLKKGEDAI